MSTHVEARSLVVKQVEGGKGGTNQSIVQFKIKKDFRQKAKLTKAGFDKVRKVGMAGPNQPLNIS